ncbi:DUF333 domain-containing protein [Bdellovibrio sp.]|uniref:DUF333 domain-containing protein n=1 Tax=Bdellovibrio sp. TaxID=28201 RepID=UPI0039E49FA6
MFSPGPAYCEAMKGKPFIAFNKKGETFDFCRFQDGSMLDSWSALFVHYPKKVIR